MICPNCGTTHADTCKFCLHCGTRLEAQPAAPEAELTQPVTAEPAPTAADALQEMPLFEKAYKAYLSTDPQEHGTFEALLGSPELKEAYEEECARCKAAIANGEPRNPDISYLDFMGVLCAAYPAPEEAASVVEEPAPEPPILAEEPIAEEEEIPEDEATVSMLPNAIPEELIPEPMPEPIPEPIPNPMPAAPMPTPPAPKKAGKKGGKGKTLIPIILLALLLVAALVLNVLQYLQGQDSAGVIASQETEIESLNSTIAEHEKTITNQKSTIASQEREISELEVTSGYYDTICQELSSGNVGYAADNFHVNKSVIVVDKDETNCKFTLTAHWPGGGTVTTDHSGYAAYVSYDQNSWDTSTQMTVEPYEEGVTIVTFSNDKDSRTFKMLIIVTD